MRPGVRRHADGSWFYVCGPCLLRSFGFESQPEAFEYAHMHALSNLHQRYAEQYKRMMYRKYVIGDRP